MIKQAGAGETMKTQICERRLDDDFACDECGDDKGFGRLCPNCGVCNHCGHYDCDCKGANRFKVTQFGATKG